MILLIDNYDSFSYNLYQLIGTLTSDIKVIRNDEMTVEEIEAKGWSLVPSKYIEFRNRDENIDFDTKMKQLQSEMQELLHQEEASKKELLNLFKELGYGIG